MSARPSRIGNIGSEHAGGQGFTPGHWRADKPGSAALPSGPAQPIEHPDPPPVSERDSRPRDARTAANLAQREQSLQPRRWRPEE